MVAQPQSNELIAILDNSSPMSHHYIFREINSSDYESVFSDGSQSDCGSVFSDGGSSCDLDKASNAESTFPNILPVLISAEKEPEIITGNGIKKEAKLVESTGANLKYDNSTKTRSATTVAVSIIRRKLFHDTCTFIVFSYCISVLTLHC